MKDLEKFEKVTILQNGRHLVLQLDGRTIKMQKNLIIENGTEPMVLVTVSFQVPTENFEVVQEPTLTE